MMFQPRSLQQRTLYFVLVPTFILLACLSVGGFLFVRSILLSQWGETAAAKLQRTAHQIDMVLRRPKELILFLQTDEDIELNRQVFSRVVHEIEELKVVVGVNVDWPQKVLAASPPPSMGMQQAMATMHGYRLEKFEISSPKYDNKSKNRTVSLVSEIKNSGEEIVGRVEVIVSFDDLIDEIINAPWWKSNKAYLIDQDANVLASTALQFELENDFPMRAFGTMNVLERDTLAAMREKSTGTVFGPGSPPAEISGFYHLTEAPWTMVVMAPGDKILQPIVRFRWFYFFTFTLSILLILFFIRQATNRVTARIREVSARADDLAKGKFAPPLPITNRDEVSELAGSFNKMSQQLKQRLTMKREINIAREVQQNLLPKDCFSTKGIVVCGRSLYCDETGGDYFDIITFPEALGKAAAVVGDVVGHGIGAALLMTTVRALVRCRVSQSGSLDRIINDVNRLLWQDTRSSGNFVTLFYLEIDRSTDTIRWVRAGHDPAMVYSPTKEEFTELIGKGVALGVEPDWRFEYHELPIEKGGQVILIGSDGAWEVENDGGEQFGKERLKRALASSCDLHPEDIVQHLVDQIVSFKGATPQSDDITLVVVKTT